jgi:hypothetical protein
VLRRRFSPYTGIAAAQRVPKSPEADFRQYCAMIAVIGHRRS